MCFLFFFLFLIIDFFVLWSLLGVWWLVNHITISLHHIQRHSWSVLDLLSFSAPQFVILAERCPLGRTQMIRRFQEHCIKEIKLRGWGKRSKMLWLDWIGDPYQLSIQDHWAPPFNLYLVCLSPQLFWLLVHSLVLTPSYTDGPYPISPAYLCPPFCVLGQ